VAAHRHGGGNEDSAGEEDPVCAADDAGPGDADGPWGGADPAHGGGQHPDWSRIRAQATWDNPADGQAGAVVT
jgi:hypothetical protein